VLLLKKITTSKENALKFEPNEWKDMCDKLERRGKKPWVDEM
jgi:hypothetical protein